MKKLFNKKAFALLLCLVLALTALLTVTAFADTAPADGTAAQTYEEQMAEVTSSGAQDFAPVGSSGNQDSFQPVVPQPEPEPFVAPEPVSYGRPSGFPEVMDVEEPGADGDSGLVETPEQAAAEAKPAAPKRPRRTRKPKPKEGAAEGAPQGDGDGPDGNREAAE